MMYIEINPMNREAAEHIFQNGDPPELVKALLSVAYHDPDWKWVQKKCLELLNNPSEIVRGAAVNCLGQLARIHGMLDLDTVLPALQVIRGQPALTGKVEDALEPLTK